MGQGATTMAKQTKAAQAVVGEVCLYGTAKVGHGYIARRAVTGTMLSLEISEERSATGALWLGLQAVVGGGERIGRVNIHIDTAAGVPLMAVVDLAKPFPYFGDLKWTGAPVYVIEAEAIERAAAAEDR